MPIIAGGFGFTTHAHRLFEHLELDFGARSCGGARFAATAAPSHLFLGNAYATPTTIATTLRRLDDEGSRDNDRAGLAFPATRVFAPDGQPICETSARGLRTFGPEGDRPVDVTHPTFYYPEFLIDRLGLAGPACSRQSTRSAFQ